MLIKWLSKYLNEIRSNNMSVLSKSTDKLKVMQEIVDGLKDNLTNEQSERLKSIDIGWETILAGSNSPVACPTLHIELYPPYSKEGKEEKRQLQK